jgi:hypothetical protein
MLLLYCYTGSCCCYTATLVHAAATGTPADSACRLRYCPACFGVLLTALCTAVSARTRPCVSQVVVDSDAVGMELVHLFC